MSADPHGIEALSRAARDWADAPPAVGSPVGAGGWPALERAVARERRRRRAGVVGGGAAVAATALVVALAVFRSEPELSFVVRGATVSADGRLASGASPARLSFSDGTEVVMQPGARGMVVETSARGAHLRLQEGRARFAVAHRERAEWAVDAGPFVVIVHGTVFDLDWSAAPAALVVDLMAGKVVVKGPLPGGEVALEPGQRLTVRPGTGEMRVYRPSGGAAPSGVAAPGAGPREVGAPADPPAHSADTAGAGEGAGATAGRLASVAPDPSAAPAEAGRSAPLPPRGPGAAASQPRPRPASLPAAPSPRPAVAAAAAGWGARVAVGEFHAVVAEAEALGVSRCLAGLPAGSLAALADAARYARRTDLARRALLAQRRRFPATVAAHDAAFLIGRLVEDTAHDRRAALTWYDRYLDEGDGGTYVSEALGRKMLALDSLGDGDAAVAAAERYLGDFPDGAYAPQARKLRKTAR